MSTRDELLPPHGLRLGQLLNNLLSNAVKFTAAGEVTLEVTLCSAPEEELLRCRFELGDTGQGPADRPV